MALMDEFKKEREAVLKHGTLTQKIKYIWDYYKWHIMIPTFVIIFLTSFIVHLVTAPDIILNGVFLNVYKTESTSSCENIANEFYEEEKIDSKEEEITLNSNLYFSTTSDTGNYETLQALMAWNSADSLDFITGDLTAMIELTYRGYFLDLREILTEEQITKYEPYFLYMDEDFFLHRSEMISNMEDVSSMEYPDCSHPEEMDKPIPVLIDMSKSEKITELYDGIKDIPVLGVTSDKETLKTTLSFIDFLFK